MSPPTSAEVLGPLVEAVAAAGPSGVVWARGFGPDIAKSDALKRQLGGRTRVVRLNEPALPPGGMWLALARALGAEGGGDPRRRARRSVAEGLREHRPTVLVVGEAGRLPAASLASLLATAESEPGLRLLLFEGGDGELAVPLPAHAITARPPPVVARARSGSAASPAAPARAAIAPRIPRRLDPASLRWIVVGGLALLIAGGTAWWGAADPEGSGGSPDRISRTPVAAAGTAAEAPEPAHAAAEVEEAPDVDAEPAAPPPTGAVDPRPTPPASAPGLAADRPVPLSGPINLNAEPWAVIEIEGRRIGETPIGNLRLPRGAYDVRAIFPDGTSRVRRVVADGNEQFVSFRP